MKALRKKWGKEFWKKYNAVGRKECHKRGEHERGGEKKNMGQIFGNSAKEMSTKWRPQLVLGQGMGKFGGKLIIEVNNQRIKIRMHYDRSYAVYGWLEYSEKKFGHKWIDSVLWGWYLEEFPIL